MARELTGLGLAITGFIGLVASLSALDPFLAVCVCSAGAVGANHLLLDAFPNATGYARVALRLPMAVGVVAPIVAAFLVFPPLGWLLCSLLACGAGVYLASEVK